MIMQRARPPHLLACSSATNRGHRTAQISQMAYSPCNSKGSALHQQCNIIALSAQGIGWTTAITLDTPT
jgi:hypothetical protein